MALLTKKDILNSDDLKRELVPVPEWGGEVYVRAMTGAERDKWEGGIIEQRGNDRRFNWANARAKLASLTICDDTGKRIFSEADVQELSQKSSAALNRIFAVAQKLSGIGEADVEDLAGEIEKDPFGASHSA